MQDRRESVERFMGTAVVLGLLNAILIICFIMTMKLTEEESWASWLFYRMLVTLIVNVIITPAFTIYTAALKTNATGALLWLLTSALWNIVSLIFTAIDVSNCSQHLYCTSSSPGEQSLFVWVLMGHNMLAMMVGVAAGFMVAFASNPRKADEAHELQQKGITMLPTNARYVAGAQRARPVTTGSAASVMKMGL